MHEASALNSLSFDPFLFQQDCYNSLEVDIGGCQAADGLVGTPDLVAIDEGLDLGFEIIGHIIVLEQDVVVQRLVPALDLALGLGMEGTTQDVPDAASSSHSARSAVV